MKRFLVSALAFVLSGVAVSAVLAMPHGKGGGKHWKERMGLTDDQGAKLKAARRALRDASTPLKDKLEDEMDRLRGLVESKAAEKDLAASVDRIRETRKALQAEREKFLDKAAAVLTAEQRAKAALAMHHGKMRVMGRKGFGGRGGHGMRGGKGGGDGEAWRHAPNDDAPDHGDDDEADD
ncbi:MAG: Spy/CpxP family protein refolding chaperone [Elusimicrobia bacterium]|nr:Spy/CpxP family protein refolding chaperone [Elusimicrobiota bacterium]